MFGPLDREALGWLLIDEAGQAVPQAAVGAIWRSQRVVAIGDPMQVPPVVTMPQRLIDAILGEHGIDPESWAAPRNSVQTLADRASWFGTTLRHEEGDLWVGSPLRVHRRCQEPMFRISNQVAYDGLMVQATPPTESEIGEVLGGSGWFHVEGGEPGHWSPAEGTLAARLLAAALEHCPGMPDLFFITPFRIVQAQLRRRLHRVLAERTDVVPWQWVRENVGTIHTFQGRQAEAVVLVLGASSPQAVGARRWAGGEPNLLNVAVSRAKSRLYVVGNRQSWRDAGVFRVLAAHLPEKPLLG
jgi:superfamily I DNA and/or RNA helicase